MTYHDTRVNSGNLTPTVISDDVKQLDKDSNSFSALEYIQQTRDRETLINQLKSITPKNSFSYKLLSNPDYLNTLTLDDLKVILMERNKLNLKHTNNKTKGKVEKQRQYKLYNSKDNLGFRQCINRNQLPREHVLRRNPYLPIPKKRSLDWHYNIPSNHNTIFAFNKIKNLLHLLFVENNKIHVVRMDLYTDYTTPESLDTINKLLNLFLIESVNRDPLCLGYCCSREKSKEGIHLHCYFFYQEMNFVLIRERIWKMGSKWKELGGKRWYSRNLDTGKLPHWEENSVIGRVDSTDFFKIERLLHCMKYLIKDLSDRSWLVGNEGNVRQSKLFTCSGILKKLSVIRHYEESVARNEIVRNGYYLSYQWLYRIGLNYNDTIFKSNPKNVKFYRNRLKEPISRYLEKQKVDIHDYKRLVY
jgi:hypothetical protein|nr:MAG TPA: Inovirus Gp2 [Caudoviricetes sp.]